MDDALPFANSPSLACRFAAVAAAYPGRTALQWAGGAYCYRELDTRSAALAARMAAAGVGAGQHIGLHIPRSPELMLAILATIRLGAVYVPLDTAYPVDRLQWMAQDAGLALLLTAPGLPSLGELPCPAQDITAWMDEAGATVTADDVTDRRDAAAYIMYTSGSTGKPKGVVIPQRGILRLCVAPEFARFDTTTRILQLAPNAFDLSTLDVWGSWLNGSTLVLAPAQMPDLATLGRQLADDRINTMWLTTSLFNLIVDEAIEILAPLQQLMTGGEALSLPHARKLMAAHPHITLVNGYGPTENTTFTNCYTIPRDIPASLPYSPLGPVIRGSYVRILDEQLHPLANGAIGEICMGGDGVALGYLNRPELNAERFIDDPLAPGHVLYRSGDMGCLRDDGTVEFHGRRDGQVKIRGYRIEPGEVESALMAHPAVKQALVMPFALPNGDKALAAFVVSAGDADSGQLRQHLSQQLPAWMVPSRFLLLDALPLNANGKADRQQLLARLANPGSTPADTAGSPPTVDDFARSVLECYRQVLDPHCQPDDAFIDLGGQSIQALRIASQLEQQFNRYVPLCWIYDHDSPAALATKLRDTPPEPLLHAVTTDSGNIPELSFPQERVWFLQQRYPDCRAYHFQATLRMHGSLDIPALNAAINSVMQRHSIFSAGYPLGDNGPVMERHAPQPITLIAEAVSDDAAAEAIVATEFLTAFDINRGPLVRWRLLALAADDHLLIQTEHHLAHDGWSFNLVLRELQAVYRSHHTGETATLPAARDFGEAVRERRQRYEQRQAARDMAWWRQELAGLQPALALPRDFPLPDKERFTGHTDRLVIDEALMHTHQALARTLGTTPFVTLLCTLLILLYRKTGQADLAIGSGVADRADAATAQLPGMLVNTILLRHDLSGDPTLRELAQRVHRHTLAALDHQGFPFDRTLALLRAQGTAGCWSSPEVMFSMHNSPSPALDWPGLSVELREALSSGTAKSPLNLVLLPTHPSADGQQSAAITLIWEYSDQHFHADTMRAWQQEFFGLLAQWPQQADARLSAISGRATPKAAPVSCAVQPFCQATVPPAFTTDSRATAIAAELTRLWESWLGGPIDPRSHFIDLGGHSLLAVQLIIRVRELFGVEVALDTFLDNPSITGLTQAILNAQTQAQETPATSNDDAPGLWRAVVPGPAKDAIFVVPGSYAREKHWYVHRQMAAGLQLQRPIYALYPPHTRPQPSVEAMAADAVKALKALSPNGASVLVGECVGGVLAFEIARQLDEAGMPVQRLVLLDSHYPARAPGGIRKRISDAWKRGRLPQQLRWAAQRGWIRIKGWRDGCDEATIARRIEQARPIIRPAEAAHYLRALASYTLKPWDGRIDYVLSEQMARHAPASPWCQAAQVQVHQATGSHHEYLRGRLKENSVLFRQLLSP